MKFQLKSFPKNTCITLYCYLFISKKYQVTTMRVDSCRKCGMVLETEKRCFECRQSIVFRCQNCKSLTDEKFHLSCNQILMEIAI